MTVCKAVLTLMISLAFLSGNGQMSIDRPLEAGDKLPDSIFHYIMEKSGRDDIPKLFVLDFWSTSCTSCIAAFPTIDSLQWQFGENIQIILVNSSENQSYIDKYFQLINGRRKKNLQPPLVMPNLPSITGDGFLRQFFPYLVVPHHVWIDEEGMVLAIANGTTTNERNIREYLRKEAVELEEKKDFPYMDTSRPLFLDEGVDENQVQQYSLLVKGSAVNFRHPPHRTNRFFVHRRSLYQIYVKLAINFLPRARHGHIIVEAEDVTTLYAMDTAGVLEEERYTYDFIIPNSDADSLYCYALTDLNRYTGYFGRIEKRNMPAYVLINKKKGNRLVSLGGEKKQNLYIKEDTPNVRQRLINGKWDSFLAWVSNTTRRTDNKRVLVDETGFTENIDIEFNELVEDYPSVRKGLQRYGLDIIEAEREVDVFVISDKEKN